MNTETVRRILKVVQDAGELSGKDIADAAKMASWKLYPTLFRMEMDGVLTSRFEAEEPNADGTPRRRLYRLTDVSI